MDWWTGGLDCGNAGRGPLGRGMVETEREKMCIRRQTRDWRTGEGKKGGNFFLFLSLFRFAFRFVSKRNENEKRKKGMWSGCITFVRVRFVFLFSWREG